MFRWASALSLVYRVLGESPAKFLQRLGESVIEILRASAGVEAANIERKPLDQQGDLADLLDALELCYVYADHYPATIDPEPSFQPHTPLQEIPTARNSYFTTADSVFYDPPAH